MRAAGAPYAIVRPCALTEEPAGAELVVDQGDNLKGKISRSVTIVPSTMTLTGPCNVKGF